MTKKILEKRHEGRLVLFSLSAWMNGLSSDGLIDDYIVLLSFLDISACPILFLY
jgi:hypothetical protein